MKKYDLNILRAQKTSFWVKLVVLTCTYLLCFQDMSNYNFFQILWKSRCNIFVSFPSHLKKLRSILRF